MLVTLFSDASFSHQTKQAGWGGWVKCTRGTAGFGGPIKVPVRQVAVAEMMAVANTVFVGWKRGLIRPGDRLCVQVDNLEVVSLLKYPTRRSKDPFMEEAHGLYRDFCAEQALTWYAKHVKAHQKGVHARSWVNEQVDRMAKAGRKTGQFQEMYRNAAE